MARRKMRSTIEHLRELASSTSFALLTEEKEQTRS